MEVYSGGRVKDAVLSCTGGIHSSTYIGSMYLNDGAEADDVTVVGKALLTVSNGASIRYVTVESNGYIYVRENAEISGEDFHSGAIVNGFVMTDNAVYSGIYSNTKVMTGCNAYLYSGQSADNISVTSSATVHISGGSAQNVTLGLSSYYTSGNAVVYSGGILNSATLIAGKITVMSGGRATNTELHVKNVESGSLIIEDSGYAQNTILHGGSMTVNANGRADNVTVYGNAQATINGYAQDITISGGQATVGGTVNNITVTSGSTLNVVTGGLVTGKLEILEDRDATVTFAAGSYLNFDLSLITVNNEDAWLSNYALIDDFSGAQFTITVNSNQDVGIYKLISGIKDQETIQPKTFQLVTSGTNLGNCIEIDETRNRLNNLTFNNRNYTIKWDGDGSVLLYITKVTSPIIVPDAPDPGPTPDPAPEPDLGKLPDFFRSKYFIGKFDGTVEDMILQVDDSDYVIYGKDAVYRTTLAGPNWSVKTSGDFNGDGADDMLRVHKNGAVVVDYSLTGGEFNYRVVNGLGAGWEVIGAGDFNGDGMDDVLLSNPTAASDGNPDHPADQPAVGLLGYWSGAAGNGGSGLDTWVLIDGYSAEWDLVGVGDFDGNGIDDMLWKNVFVGDDGKNYNAYCRWMVGNDDLVQWDIVNVVKESDWQLLSIGDFDGDGTDDMTMVNRDGIVVLGTIKDGALNGDWTTISSTDMSTWNVVGAGDFNGDGKDEIAWTNIVNSTTGYWQFNEDKQISWVSTTPIA